MEQRFRQPAHQQLQGGGDHHGSREEKRQTVAEGLQGQQDEAHAETVDGAHRAQQKAPVDKFAGLHRREDHLAAPAQKGVDEKDPKKFIPGVHAQTSQKSSTSMTVPLGLVLTV